MRLARWALVLTVLGVEAVIVSRLWTVDRHCDYTRPGIEPWWDDDGDAGNRVRPSPHEPGGPTPD